VGKENNERSSERDDPSVMHPPNQS
jgi:hypothetical protein